MDIRKAKIELECPYCGRQKMKLKSTDAGWWRFECEWCGASAPEGLTPEEAYAVATIIDTSADVKPVVRGEWKISFLYQCAVGYKCSCCDYFQLHRTRFCPNCGADMRKEVNDE